MLSGAVGDMDANRGHMGMGATGSYRRYGCYRAYRGMDVIGPIRVGLL